MAASLHVTHDIHMLTGKSGVGHPGLRSLLVGLVMIHG